MKFAYYMHGSTMGELRLEKLYPDGTRTQLFYNTEVEQAWKEHTVFLPMDTINYEVHQLSNISEVSDQVLIFEIKNIKKLSEPYFLIWRA